MKARIELEYANGETDGFTIPRRFAYGVADALCVGGRYIVRAIIDGTTYELQEREGANPLWDKAGNTRHSVELHSR